MNQENFTQPFVGLTFTQRKPTYMLTFHKEGNKVGSFDFNEGRMHFEGDVSESGQIFIDWVLSSFKQRIDDAVLAEREACIKIVEDEAFQYASPVWAFEIVNDIKARGQA